VRNSLLEKGNSLKCPQHFSLFLGNPSWKKDFDDHHNDPTDEADEVVQPSKVE
jgi:hypothetical protein